MVVDLIHSGRKEDSSLPSLVQLRTWVEGVHLVQERPKVASQKIVVLDPGHGGWDHGAVGITGTREADIALQLALRTRDLLQKKRGD